MSIEVAAEKRPLVCLFATPSGLDSRDLEAAVKDRLERWMPSSVGTLERTSASGLAIPPLSDIRKADAIVADITGSDPNVMYEIGYARGQRVPVLPIVDKNSKPGKIPSDLSMELIYPYDSVDDPELANYIADWLWRWVGERWK